MRTEWCHFGPRLFAQTCHLELDSPELLVRLTAQPASKNTATSPSLLLPCRIPPRWGGSLSPKTLQTKRCIGRPNKGIRTTKLKISTICMENDNFDRPLWPRRTVCLKHSTAQAKVLRDILFVKLPFQPGLGAWKNDRVAH